KGDVQWMTAASGILHKEYQEAEYSKQGGPFQMVQLWVNLPAKDKMSTPKYQAITKAQMGRHELGDAGYVDVIAGNFQGEKGPANTFTPIEMYNLHLKKGGETGFDLPADFNTALLVVEGSVRVNDSENVPLDHFALFKNEGERIVVRAEEDSIVLVLSGEPIDEPLTSYGPFVMNTQEEIQQAFDDYNRGKFGYLDED
ncbi:MAG: pirin family protein, partial [Mucilaginibacter polytrichastri]|nr:pirin family protein [Mucilaginibacter polytrichastri]